MSVCRVCIHADRDGDPVTVDVALPSGSPVGELLPAIVDMVDVPAGPDAAPRLLRLDTLAGDVLDESLSLRDNGIRDGDVLVLQEAHMPTLGPIRMQPTRAMTLAHPPDERLGERLRSAFCVGATGLASLALGACAGTVQATPSLIVTATGACAAAAVAMTSGFGSASTVAFISLTATTGFLAVPSAPAAPNVFLAAAAGMSAALVVMRWSGRPSATAVAALSFSMLCAAVTLMTLPAPSTGAALSSMALVLLAVAPRTAVLVSRLRTEGRSQPEAEVTARAETAHATLTGLVVGAAGGTAAGALLSVADTPAHAGPTLAFTALLAVLLLLRIRTHADPVRRLVLLAAGLGCGAACVRIALESSPQYLGAAGAVLVAAGLVSVRVRRISRQWSRALDRVEYVALAAVVPVAGWAGGLYDVFDGFHL